MTEEGPRHRTGRPVAELLAEHHMPLVARSLLVRRHAQHAASGSARPGDVMHIATRHAGPAGDDRAAAATAQIIRNLGGVDVVSAASILRRRAANTLTRLYDCRARMRSAAQTADSFRAQLDTANATAHQVLQVQAVDTRLVAVLQRLGDERTQLAQAQQRLAQFYPHGGMRVASPATRDHLRHRVTLAQSDVEATTTYAWQIMRVLAEETHRGEHLVRAIDQAIDHVLERIVGAPPPILRLIRAALPRPQRSDWWRELVAILAEATPDERRTYVRSLLLGAPRTIWSSWAITRRRQTRPARDTNDL